MTERLYYDDSYLTEFDAFVREVRPEGWVRLDRSAFYPTSGGQPYDTGALNGLKVTDVEVTDGDVWHKAEGPLTPGQAVHGVIDWPRRFDHMQQHGGEHLLAGEIWRQLGGMTIGLHLGREDSTIDCDMPDGRTRITEEELRALEDAVNGHIQADAPCRCWFPGAEELAALPLRKAPTVKEHVRIVAFGDFEMVACGGTHPKSAGQIGLVKILDARPARGKIRFTFVCGGRAFRDYRARFDALGQAAELLSAGCLTLPEKVQKLKDENYALRAELSHLRRDQALSRIRDMAGEKVCAAVFDGVGMDALQDASRLALSQGAAYALLGSKEEDGCLLLFARAQDQAEDMGQLMRRCGAKGGGRPDFAQGRSPSPDCLAAARSLLE